MPPVQFCTQQDLERALGGAAELVQLLDRDGDNVADADAVTDVLDSGTNEIASYLQIVIDLGSLTSPYPRVLVLKTADVCAYHAWARGAQHQAVPDNIREMYDSAIRWATDVGHGRAGLGSLPRPKLDTPVAVVDPDPDATGVSVAGFKRGFR